MNLRIFKIFLLVGLAMVLALPAHAQKSKIKKGKKSAKTDSTKVVATPPPGAGKAAIKGSVVPGDGNQAAMPDSLRAQMIQMANASADSSFGGIRDSLAKPPKRFYTRVKEAELVAAEQRSRSMLDRIEIAEERLYGYREASEAGEKGAFSKEELDKYEAAIARARLKLASADSSLLAVRSKMAAEGKLGTANANNQAPPLNTDTDDDDDEGEGTDDAAMPPPSTGGGKGSIKSLQETPPSKGKGKIKGKGSEPQEEDIDNG